MATSEKSSPRQSAWPFDNIPLPSSSEPSDRKWLKSGTSSFEAQATKEEAHDKVDDEAHARVFADSESAPRLSTGRSSRPSNQSSVPSTLSPIKSDGESSDHESRGERQEAQTPVRRLDTNDMGRSPTIKISPPVARGAIAVRPEFHDLDTPREARGERVATFGTHSRNSDSQWYGVASHANSVIDPDAVDCENVASIDSQTAAKKWYRSTRCIVITVLMMLMIVLAIVLAVWLGIRSNNNHNLPSSETTTTTTNPEKMPSGPCSAQQIHRGCAPGFCGESHECACSPNDIHYMQDGSAHCAAPLENHLMDFYMYALRGDDDAGMDSRSTGSGADTGSITYSLQGVMWYLHNNVVTKSCPRNQGITRIQRFKATMYNTEVPFNTWNGQFGPYANFVDGKCVGQNCTELYSTYGFVVGCLQWQPFMGGTSYGISTQRYSLPGNLQNGTFSGGHCAKPDGTAECTWNLESAGEVMLDELEGIDDYKAFCAAGDIEYDPNQDHGKGCSFWDDRKNSTANDARIARLQKIFLKKFPGSALPEPRCDSQNSDCRYHEECRGLLGKCCPHDNGLMLSCCNQQDLVL